MNSRSSISVVIPTRNRPESLNRMLASLAVQTFPPTEIIIIDASDSPLMMEQINFNANLPVQLHHSTPSVCAQRNIGIEKSTSDYIFLLDDDIELSENYCEVLVSFLDNHTNETIASGLVMEKNHKSWTYSEKRPSAFGLSLAYLFGFSVGFDANVDPNQNWLVKHYKNKGNRIAKSGWPIIVNFGGNHFQTPIYGLGASLMRSSALKKTAFDASFAANGIGDNYDLAVSLNANVNVISEAKAFHHRESANRLQAEKAYRYRINALHYILLKHQRFGKLNLVYFCWSLLGKSLVFLGKTQFKTIYYNLEAITRILCHRPLYKSKN